jgi:uncharacterized protein
MHHLARTKGVEVAGVKEAVLDQVSVHAVEGRPPAPATGAAAGAGITGRRRGFHATHYGLPLPIRQTVRQAKTIGCVEAVFEYNEFRTDGNTGGSQKPGGGRSMLRIHLEQLKGKNLAREVESPADGFTVLRQMIRKGECEFAASIRIRFKAARIGELVEVDGEFQTLLRLTCGRCLKPFLSPLQAGFSMTYMHETAAADGGGSKRGPADAEAVGLIGFRGDTIDLRDGIQEQVVLSLPVRPLCGETCRGLCLHCGADLNLGNCPCSPASTDSAFAVLRKLTLK